MERTRRRSPPTVSLRGGGLGERSSLDLARAARAVGGWGSALLFRSGVLSRRSDRGRSRGAVAARGRSVADVVAVSARARRFHFVRLDDLAHGAAAALRRCLRHGLRGLGDGAVDGRQCRTLCGAGSGGGGARDVAGHGQSLLCAAAGAGADRSGGRRRLRHQAGDGVRVLDAAGSGPERRLAGFSVRAGAGAVADQRQPDGFGADDGPGHRTDAPPWRAGDRHVGAELRRHQLAAQLCVARLRLLLLVLPDHLGAVDRVDSALGPLRAAGADGAGAGSGVSADERLALRRAGRVGSGGREPNAGRLVGARSGRGTDHGIVGAAHPAALVASGRCGGARPVSRRAVGGRAAAPALRRCNTAAGSGALRQSHRARRRIARRARLRHQVLRAPPRQSVRSAAQHRQLLPGFQPVDLHRLRRFEVRPHPGIGADRAQQPRRARRRRRRPAPRARLLLEALLLRTDHP